MRICLVTTFPPSRGGLSEYGLHIAQELQRNPLINLTILADELSAPERELEEFNVARCWSPDRPRSFARLLSQIRKRKPDVVWFNLLFSTFGRNPLNAFGGLMIPFLTRMHGRYTHVTLHHLMDTVDLQDLGVRFAYSYRLAGAVATRMLLLSNSVSVLMPRYREILSEKYGGNNVHVRSHGILTQRPQPPDFLRRGNPVHRILAFGKWGTYKRLELMIEAFCKLRDRVPNVQLVIAGGNHPQAAGYVEAVREKCNGEANIEFTGYVSEEQLADLFQSSSVAVMPYSSSTGSSGVAHLSCAFSVPIVCANLPDFQQMAEGEDLAVEFHRAGDAQDLADCLINLLQDSEKLRAMALQNFSAALRMTMPTIVQKYLRHFQVQQQIGVLRHVAKFRRLPDWLPSKNFLFRAMTRTWKSWVDHSAIFRPGSDRTKPLLHKHGNGRGNLAGRGIPIDGNGIAGSRTGGRTGTAWPPAPAGSQHQTDTESTYDRETAREDSSSASAAYVGESDQAQGEHPYGKNEFRVSGPQVSSGLRDRRDGESRSRTASDRSDEVGREGTAENAGEIAAGEPDFLPRNSRLDRGRNREAS